MQMKRTCDSADMPKLKVLLSYTQHDLTTTTALVEALRAEFEVRWTTDLASAEDPEADIPADLAWSDVVVPVVTSEWLRSYECRDELARAHERRIPIILFRCIAIADDGPKMPQYLKQELSIFWSEEQLGHGLQVLAGALRGVSDNHSQKTGSEPARPVTHIVLLRPAVDSVQLAEYLHCLVDRFHIHRTAFRLNRIFVAKRCDLSVTDSRYTAPLRVSTDFTYALIANFDDESALQHYYQNELHSVERERLYVLLNPDVEAKFAEASRPDSAQNDRRAEIFSSIERQMIEGGFIQRIDLRDDAAPQALESSCFMLDSPGAHKQPAATTESMAARGVPSPDRHGT